MSAAELPNERGPQPQHGDFVEPTDEEMDALYDRYAKPLEADHYGEFIAIARDGRHILGTSIHEVMEQAEQELGLGVCLFKFGPRVIGRVRWCRRWSAADFLTCRSP